MPAEMNTQAHGSSFLIPHTYPGRYKESPETWTLLKEAGRQFETMRPDLILITGDLTNDGLDEQFQRVKCFIDSLDFCRVPVLTTTVTGANEERTKVKKAKGK
jgi:3',5'-cyclic AMP phosphodiesterase CpdA